MMEANLPIRLRHANDTDIDFIFSSWLKSNRSSRNMEGIAPNFYFAGQHKVIEGLLKSCTTLVACNEADPTQIYGYVNFERVEGIFILHYLYTKHSFRKLGIAKRLLIESGHDHTIAAIYTHRPFQSDSFMKKCNFVFNPFFAYHGYEKADK